MTPTPTRRGWRAALIGVSRYVDPGFTDIPAARNNVDDLARLLTASTSSALAGHQCSVVTDPEDSAQVGRVVSAAAREAHDVLFVYFAGHGLVDRRGQLYLALTGTSRDHPEWSSVPFATLRDEIIASPARARILILDCCFSGRAIEAMSASSSLIDGQIDIQGTYTIASSGRNVWSVAPEGHRRTAFTAALLSTATVAGLSLDQLYQKVEQALHRQGYPRPQRRAVNVAGDLRLFTPPALRPISGDSASVERIIGQPSTEAVRLFQDGQGFMDQDDLAQAENSWRLAALQGHSGAMHNLANLVMARGQAREAHDWYRKAAEGGNVDAMCALASLLDKIRLVDDAERWWRRAAECGNTDAMYNLAIRSDKSGYPEAALTWYRQAAEADQTDAMHNLAIRLRDHGLLTEATTWWQRAGHKRAQGSTEKLRGQVVFGQLAAKSNVGSTDTPSGALSTSRRLILIVLGGWVDEPVSWDETPWGGGIQSRAGRGYFDGMPRDQLLESARVFWRFNPESPRWRDRDYAVVVHAGITRAVIRIDRHIGPFEDRYGFKGQLVDDPDLTAELVGKTVPHRQNPITTWN